MGKVLTKDGKLLYHLTKLSNLDSIIQNGLMSRRDLECKGLLFEDVADPEILVKRNCYGLDRYIPFHFNPYSSFDVAVKNSHHEEFIYICIYRQYAKNNGFYILPRHPLSSTNGFELFEYNQGMEQIDWEAMEISSTTSPYHKSVHMAECLTDKVIPFESFQQVAVRNEGIKQLVVNKILDLFPGHPYGPYINVHSTWFPNSF